MLNCANRFRHGLKNTLLGHARPYLFLSHTYRSITSVAAFIWFEIPICTLIYTKPLDGFSV